MLVFRFVNEMEKGKEGLSQLGQGMKDWKGLVQTHLTELFSCSGMLWAWYVLAGSHAALRRASAGVQDQKD